MMRYVIGVGWSKNIATMQKIKVICLIYFEFTFNQTDCDYSMDQSKLFSFEEQPICLMMNDIQFEPFSLAKPN